MNEEYLRFKNAVRPDVKLKICLDAYICLNRDIERSGCRQDGEESKDVKEYLAYLSARKRAAWEVLIREENLEGLRLFARHGWLTGEEARVCLNLAVRTGKRESQLWLLQYMKNPDKAGTEAVREIRSRESAGICREILDVLKQKLQSRIPAMASALPYLDCIQTERKLPDKTVWGTDGSNLYYAPDELISCFRQGMNRLARNFLHSLFHCLYLHMLLPELSGSTADTLNTSGSEAFDDCWNLACDLAVEWAIDASSWYPLETKRQKSRYVWYQQILGEQKGRDTRACYNWLTARKKEGQYALLQEMQNEFSVDCHDYWYEKKDQHREKSLEVQEDLAATWGDARQGISLMLCGSGQRAGKQEGKATQEYRPGNKKTYDYRKFLKQFAVCREEMQLDMESFDYIPYYYGLERYGNVLLVEPLETTEVNRLEEFVIAIDTSGSCSGETVCRFLDETYQILSSRENFFRKMNVHIIQCDSVIQDHQKITCEEEWRAYQENVKIQGLGGTDFTPVFRLVDKMIEEKEIRHLKGLLYFTDGDGVFPRERPSYEAAFVFLNRALEKSRIPDWAIRLNLEM